MKHSKILNYCVHHSYQFIIPFRIENIKRFMIDSSIAVKNK